MATTPPHSANGTTPPNGKFRLSAPSIIGRPVLASNISTASSTVRTATGSRACSAAPRRSRTPTPAQGFHLTTALTDDAIHWIRQHEAVAPDKPFFVYLATAATHAPHQVPKEWIERYKGKFDAGWDKMRDETFARQKKMGVIPADCQLTTRHKEIPAWDDMPEALKPVLRRQMEVYAGFMEYTDHHVGRLLDALEKLKILDDTLVYYIIGDNGASAEGTLNGTFNEMLNFNGMSGLETPEFLTARLDKLGGPESTTTLPSAGHMPWTRRTSGPNRSHPTGAGPEMAPSSTGRRGSRPRARCVGNSTTSSTLRPRFSRQRACRSQSR